ncbi:DUF6194 family protein [Nocardia wallacei]|uniref:DUF6194 family protein n=1 Tax=Nocardia wallacei TaxID=480035 RepID=UPI002454379C|nr:DUF6194 family protein [Nocardia wallacei]
MSIDEIIEFIESLGGVLTLRPGPGDGTPEIAWGDAFFYYAPDGQVPTTGQPFATIVTKDYPDDTASRLNRPDAFRLNISAGKEAFIEWTGHTPRETPAVDASATDTVLPHPVYGSAAWLAIVNPGPSTEAPARELLRAAHDRARSRYERRAER